MAVGQSTISGLENSEIRGTIKLDTLRRAAAALDCDVIYYLVPRTSLEDTVRLQARRKAHEQLAREPQPVPVEYRSAADSSDPLDELASGYMDRRGLWTD